ncbi:hypothetical protein PIB30_020889 [Stylosanthes scabra]|uniref:GRF-type domain-containing protein n=1 Tax=Stylosanthes scabra TaxID=79078 RepID=A0ABU6X6X8_9FABA|nr:hypothetical protein [Stylosanthes scabra]
MSSQSQSSRSRWSRTRSQSLERTSLLCHHGKEPVLRVSETSENPGRRFWGCVYYDVGSSPPSVKEQCQFFQWAEPAKDDDGYIEVARLKKKVACLKVKLKAAEWRLIMAIAVGLVGWVGMLCMWVYESGKRRPPYVGAKGLI